MPATTLDGLYGVYPDGCEALAVRIKNGKVVSVLAAHMLSTFAAANDRRADDIAAMDRATEVDRETATRVLTAYGEYTGDECDPEQYVVCITRE